MSEDGHPAGTSDKPSALGGVARLAARDFASDSGRPGLDAMPGGRGAALWSASSRFAIYYAPSEDSLWWRAGCHWLGRDPQTGETFEPPVVAELAARGLDVAGLSRAPRRYGWHGTLVAPARCAANVTPDDVLHEALEWGRQQKCFELPVEVASLGRFVALRPQDADGAAAMAAIAADALRTLMPLRAMATEQERQRRLEADLTARQRKLLERWGYPYVLDEFRFHMTLSDSIADASQRDIVLDWWREQAPTLGPLAVDGAALFVEPEPGAPFALWARLPFGSQR
jgi:putative phosphonate metabolism protein